MHSTNSDQRDQIGGVIGFVAVGLVLLALLGGGLWAVKYRSDQVANIAPTFDTSETAENGDQPADTTNQPDENQAPEGETPPEEETPPAPAEESPDTPTDNQNDDQGDDQPAPEETPEPAPAAPEEDTSVARNDDETISGSVAGDADDTTSTPAGSAASGERIADTGPAETMMSMAALGLLAGSTVTYLQSRRAAIRR